MIILAFIVTVIAGFLSSGFLGSQMNWPDAGAIVAIAVMGSFILWTLRHPRDGGGREK